MFRKVGVLILSIAMMLIFAGPAAAGPWWCEDDPILHFSDGTSVHLVTSSGGTSVTYGVHVPVGTTLNVTYPNSGQIPSVVNWTADGPAGTASITVTVSGGDGTLTVTQTGGGAGQQTYSGIGGTAAFSVTLGG